MSRRKNIDWSGQPLGEVSDQQIADALGCSQFAVWLARTRRGIPAFQPQFDWQWEPLGKVPDQRIADSLGCSRAAVALARKRLDIPAFKPRKVQS